MRLAVIAASVYIAALASAHAEYAAFSGVGVTSCTEFAQHYKLTPKAADFVYFSWAQGFMSGYNASLLAKGGTGKDLDAESNSDEEVHIRDFCDQHPLVPFVRAVLDLYLSLPAGASHKSSDLR